MSLKKKPTYSYDAEIGIEDREFILVYRFESEYSREHMPLIHTQAYTAMKARGELLPGVSIIGVVPTPEVIQEICNQCGRHLSDLFIKDPVGSWFCSRECHKKFWMGIACGDSKGPDEFEMFKLEINYFKGPWGKWGYSGEVEFKLGKDQQYGEALETAMGALPNAPGILSTWADARKEYHIVVSGGPFPFMFQPDGRVEVVVLKLEGGTREEEIRFYKVKTELNKLHPEPYEKFIVQRVEYRRDILRMMFDARSWMDAIFAHKEAVDIWKRLTDEVPKAIEAKINTVLAEIKEIEKETGLPIGEHAQNVAKAEKEIKGS